jgi:hypothetical protein
MSAGYPLDLERKIARRWLHQFVPRDRPMPLDRPRHPNDIRPLPKRPPVGMDQLPKSEIAETDLDERKPSRRGQGRHLMDF